MTIVAQIAAFTHRGRVRRRNEDTVVVGDWISPPDMAEPRAARFSLSAPLLCAVADGLGGHRAGEVASRRAAEMLAAAVAELTSTEGVVACLGRINDALYRAMADDPSRAGMGTTIVGIVLATRMVWFNIGDSRLYRFRGGELTQVSIDDTPAGPRSGMGTTIVGIVLATRMVWFNIGDSRLYRFRGGELTQVSIDDTPAGPRTGMLTHCLSGAMHGAPVRPHVGDFPAAGGLRLLLCSDGLTDMLEDADIADCLSLPPAEAVAEGEISAAPGRRAAGVAFHAGTVAHQREVAALLAGLAFVTPGARLGPLVGGRGPGLRTRLRGARRVELLGRRKPAFGLALKRDGAGDFGARRGGAERGHPACAGGLRLAGEGRSEAGSGTSRSLAAARGHDREPVRARTRQAFRHVARRGRGLAFLLALAERVESDIARIHRGEVEALEIADRELAEDVIENRSRVFDRIVALHRAGRLEACEGEGIDIFLERYAILQAERDGDRKIVEKRAQRGAFLVHVDEDFAEPPVVIFAGAEIDLMPADDRLLRVALAAIGQALALAQDGHAFDDLLHHLLRKAARARSRRTLEEGFDCRLLLVLVLGHELCVERLRKLRAVAIERVGLEAELPGEQIGRLAVLDGRVVGHVDGLGDRTRDEGLRRRHHADMAFDGKETLAGAAARVGAIEHRIVLGLEMRSAFDRHGAADVNIGGLDLAPGEAERGQQIEVRGGKLVGRNFQDVAAEILAERPLVEGELDVEGRRQCLLDLGDGLVGKAFGLEGGVVDRRRLRERAVSHGIGLDLGDLRLAVAERAQRFRHRAIDDLPVAAADEFLELDEGEIRFDAGGVAIHDEADRTGRRDDRRLGVAIAVLLAEAERPVPGRRGVRDQPRIGTGGVVERDGRRGHLLIAGALAIGRAAVIADDAQHMLAVLLEAGERPELLGHLGGSGIGDAGHDRGERATDRAAGIRVVGNARAHQQAADIGVAEAERAEFVGQLRHQHRDLEHDGPQTDGVLE